MRLGGLSVSGRRSVVALPCRWAGAISGRTCRSQGRQGRQDTRGRRLPTCAGSEAQADRSQHAVCALPIACPPPPARLCVCHASVPLKRASPTCGETAPTCTPRRAAEDPLASLADGAL